MITGFYTGAQGVMANQASIDVASNNIANVNTYGYKPQRLSFQTLLYRAIRPDFDGVDPSLKVGHGARGVENAKNMAAGPLESTQRALDLSIQGDGFFAVGDPYGNVYYTRNGAFDISEEEGGSFLVTTEGYYVLDPEGQRISLPVGQEGGYAFAGPEGAEEGAVRLGVYSFSNPYALDMLGRGYYATTQGSGEALASDAEIRSGSLEMSGVELSQEMVNVIRAQRAYQLNLRVVTTADEIEQTTNNLRG